MQREFRIWLPLTCFDDLKFLLLETRLADCLYKCGTTSRRDLIRCSELKARRAGL